MSIDFFITEIICSYLSLWFAVVSVNILEAAMAMGLQKK